MTWNEISGIRFRRNLVFLIVGSCVLTFMGACSSSGSGNGSIISPSSTSSSVTSGSGTPATVDPPTSPTAPAAQGVSYKITLPPGMETFFCGDSDPSTTKVVDPTASVVTVSMTVNNVSSNGLRIHSTAYRSDVADCRSTIADQALGFDPKPGTKVNFNPGESGVAEFTWRPERTCGAQQLDLAGDDRTRFVKGFIFNMKSNCTPPPTPPACSAVTASLVINQTVPSATLYDFYYTPTVSGPAGTTATLTVNSTAVEFVSGVQKRYTVARPEYGMPNSITYGVLTPKVGDVTCVAKSVSFITLPKDPPAQCSAGLTMTMLNGSVRIQAVTNPPVPEGYPVSSSFTLDGTPIMPPIVLTMITPANYTPAPSASTRVMRGAINFRNPNGASCTAEASLSIPPTPPVCTFEPMFRFVHFSVTPVAQNLDDSIALRGAMLVKTVVDVQNKPSATSVALVRKYQGSESVVLTNPIEGPNCDKIRLTMEYTDNQYAEGVTYSVKLMAGSTTLETLELTPTN